MSALRRLAVLATAALLSAGCVPPPAQDRETDSVLQYGLVRVYTHAELQRGATGGPALAVRVDRPAPYQPSATAQGVTTDAAVAVPVTLTNVGSRPVELPMVSVRARSASLEATKIFDIAQGMPGTPPQLLPAGQAAHFAMTFAVADPADVAVQVIPSLLAPPVIFTS